MSKPALPIMAHLVLGYPTLAESIATAEKYVAAGVAVLELQIPFSHPTADGPVITAACREAVENQHVGMQDCLDAIQFLREKHPAQEIMVMSYLNRIYAFGAEKFAREMAALGVGHLIVPDLPVDATMAARFGNFGEKNSPGLSAPRLVPVLAANIPAERLEKLLGMDFDFFYLMSDFKITGSGFGLHPNLEKIIAEVRRRKPGARVGIGFGISNGEQARKAAEVADLAIVGSALISAQTAGRLDVFLEELKGAFLEKLEV